MGPGENRPGGGRRRQGPWGPTDRGGAPPEYGRLRRGAGPALPVVLWDERGSTVTAARYLNATDTRGKKRKAVIDAVAAVVILESYLGWRKNHPED